MPTYEITDYLPLLLPIGTIVAISVPAIYIAIHKKLEYRSKPHSREITNTPATPAPENKLVEISIADLERMLREPYPKNLKDFGD